MRLHGGCHRKEIRGEDVGTVHFHGADNQAHETLCGHSLNFCERGDQRGPVRYEDVHEDVTCTVCLQAAVKVLEILGFTRARAKRHVERVKGGGA